MNVCPTCILESNVSDGEAVAWVVLVEILDNEFFAVRIDVNVILLPDDRQVEVPIPQNCTVHCDVFENLGKNKMSEIQSLRRFVLYTASFKSRLYYS